MEFAVTQEEDRAHFKLEGSIDEHGAEDLKQRFRQLNASSLKEVVFDFGEVNYIGSAGIGKLLLFYKDLAPQDCKIRIENLSDSIYRLFMVLKLDKLFTISSA